MRIKNKINRRSINKRKKVTKQHLEAIKAFSETNRNFPIQLKDIKAMLTNKFSELESIAWTTIGRRIKSDMNMSINLELYFQPHPCYSHNHQLYSSSLRSFLSSLLDSISWSCIWASRKQRHLDLDFLFFFGVF